MTWCFSHLWRRRLYIHSEALLLQLICRKYKYTNYNAAFQAVKVIHEAYFVVNHTTSGPHSIIQFTAMFHMASSLGFINTNYLILRHFLRRVRRKCRVQSVMRFFVLDYRGAWGFNFEPHSTWCIELLHCRSSLNQPGPAASLSCEALSSCVDTPTMKLWCIFYEA